MEQEILKSLLVSSPLALTAYILWKSGVLGALASRLKKNGDDKRVTELESWREVAETNHFHDLEELKVDVRELKKEVKGINDRLIVVETRQVNNRTKKWR